MEAAEKRGPTHIHLRTVHTPLEEHQWSCSEGKNTKWGRETQEESHSSTVLCPARRCSCPDPGEPTEANTGQIKHKKHLVFLSHTINRDIITEILTITINTQDFKSFFIITI